MDKAEVARKHAKDIMDKIEDRPGPRVLHLDDLIEGISKAMDEGISWAMASHMAYEPPVQAILKGRVVR